MCTVTPALVLHISETLQFHKLEGCQSDELGARTIFFPLFLANLTFSPPLSSAEHLGKEKILHAL